MSTTTGVIIKEDFNPRVPPEFWSEVNSPFVHSSTWDYRIARLGDGPSLALASGDPSLAAVAACNLPAVLTRFHNEFEFRVEAYPDGLMKVQTLYGPNGPTELSNIYLLGELAGYRKHWLEFFGGNDGISLNIEEEIPLGVWVKIIRSYEFVGTQEVPAIQTLRFELPDGHVSQEISMVCRYYNPSDPNWMPGGVNRFLHVADVKVGLKIRNVLVSA